MVGFVAGDTQTDKDREVNKTCALSSLYLPVYPLSRNKSHHNEHVPTYLSSMLPAYCLYVKYRK